MKKTDLSEGHISWITCHETLMRQVGMSLEDRTLDFMKQWPDKKICTTTLRNIYFKHRIRRKKIKTTKLIDDTLRRRIKRQTAQSAEQLQEMISRGFRIVYVDETMVTKSTMPTHEWSGPREQLKVDYNQFGRDSIAIIGAISQERGVDLMMPFDKSINRDKFKIFLEELRARHFFDDICIVLDNLAVHHSHEIIDRLDELSFEYVFTPPYSPDFNPIESVFSMFKGRLKRMRFRAIQHGENVDLLALIRQIWGDLEREKIINCIEHALKLMFQEN